MKLLDRFCFNLNVEYVSVEAKSFATLETQATIPREDIGVYLTAQAGEADCFVFANHKLIQSLVQDTKEFECLTSVEFVKKYLG